MSYKLSQNLGYEVGRHYQSLIVRPQPHAGPNIQDRINNAEIDNFSSQLDSKAVPMQDEDERTTRLSTAEVMQALHKTDPGRKLSTPLPQITPTFRPAPRLPFSLYPPIANSKGKQPPKATTARISSKVNTLKL